MGFSGTFRTTEKKQNGSTVPGKIKKVKLGQRERSPALSQRERSPALSQRERSPALSQRER
jgi:hypothetical protein